MTRGIAALAALAAAGTLAAQNPGGKMVETKEGVVFQKNTPMPRPTWGPSSKPDDSGGGLVKVAPSKPAEPSGPAVVNAAFVTYRGSVVKVEKDEAITILDGRTGKERRVLLAKGASLPEGLKAGDAVSLRVPLEHGSGARTADRVERQPTPAALDPKSKFVQPSSSTGR